MDSLEMMMKMGLMNQAAYQLPQQLQNDRAAAAEDLRTKQLANDQSAIMNPLNSQFRQGQINEQQAQLPGLQGQSQTLAAQGQFDTATLAQRTAAQISKYSGQIGDDGMKQVEREGQVAGLAANVLKSYPPALHKEVLSSFLQKSGVDVNNPTVQSLLQLPAEQIQPAAAAMGEGMAKASADYLQKSALQADDNRSKEKIGAGHDAATIRAAELQAESRKAAAASRASMIKYMNPEQKITALSSIPPEDRTPDEQAQLTQLTQYMLSKPAAGSNQVAPQVLGQQTNQQTAQSTGAAIFGGGGQAAPAPAAKTIVATGKTSDGRKVVKYSDGSIDYAN